MICLIGVLPVSDAFSTFDFSVLGGYRDDLMDSIEPTFQVEFYEIKRMLLL